MVLNTFRRIAVALMPVVCLVPAIAHAEPVLVSIEGQAAMAVTKPQSDLFGIGGVAAVALHYPIAPAFLLGVRLQAGLLSNGNAPSDHSLKDPGNGTWELAMLNVRLRPFAAFDGLRRATGLYIDLGAGGGVTGTLGRAAFSGGIGYGFAIGSCALGPTVRYMQILQPPQTLASDDARVVSVGLELTFGDDAREPEAPPPELPPPPAAPSDRDHDGIDDAHDKCPDQPEDHDGFQDEDGCPDPDNDKDAIPDVKDKCPNDPEDYDEFEDEDGCPDPDNDYDGFLDADDQCPNEAEVVNGNEDYDGCPDEGLITMDKDRIVLEERVLFDTDRARISHEARPILKAIVKLKEQHPEWTLLRIEGHADARGSAQYNQELSERRANHVMLELIKLGFPADEIHAVGYGSTRLRDKRDEEEAHQRNRRVEFVVETRGAAPQTIAPAAAAASKPTPDAKPSAKPEAKPPEPPPSAADDKATKPLKQGGKR